MAAQGGRVVLAARRDDEGRGVARAITEAGGEAVFVRADVTRTEDVQLVVARAVEQFGRLDCAVNNAGIAGPVAVPIGDVEEHEWDDVMNLNLRAVWLCMKFEIAAMLAGGAGSIVNVSSIYGYKPSPIGHAAYAASKHGVIGLTKSAAIDYARQGLRFNVVAPGFTRSEMVNPDSEGFAGSMGEVISRHSAMDRVGEAHESAAVVAWLCSDAATFVNGAVIAVDGGDMTRMY